MVSLTAAASCLGCDWTASGKPADVDKAAEKHTKDAKTGHATGTVMRPGGSVSGDNR